MQLRAAILAGGRGSRLSEETSERPKPMVEIGGAPILWHIMELYGRQGFDEFTIALGYMGDVIEDWFRAHHDRVDANGWAVECVDTGRWTNTGGRLKRLDGCLGDGTFMLTWGDGLADVDLRRLLAFHRNHGRLATVTAVHPPARFGQLELDGDQVRDFTEKPLEQSWINGAFFVLEPEVLDYIDGDDTQWEKEPMERLAKDGELMAYRHEGFWQCMDTIRDKAVLERLWRTGAAPWLRPERNDVEAAAS